MAQHYKTPLFVQVLLALLTVVLLSAYLHTFETTYYWPLLLSMAIITAYLTYRWLSPLENLLQAVQRYRQGETQALSQLPDASLGQINNLIHEFKTIVTQTIENQTRLESVLDTVSTAIVTITENGTVESFNEAAQRLFGYSADEVIGKNVKLLMPDEYKYQHDGYLKKYGETGNASIIGKGRELLGIRKNGECFPLFLHVGQVDLQHSRLFTGVMEDLSKLKASETTEKSTRQQLEEEVILAADQKNRLESIVNTVGSAIITITDKGIIESFNEAAQKIFGYSNTEVIGKNVKMLMPAEHKHQHDNYLKKYQETGKTNIIGSRRELIGIRKSREEFPMYLDVSQVALKDRIIYTGAIEDLSELKHAQISQQQVYQALEQEKNRLQQQDWVKTAFSDLNIKLHAKNRIEDFADELLNNLVPLLDAQLGVFYLQEISEQGLPILKCYQTYGCNTEQQPQRIIAVGDGLIGECANTQKMLHLTDVPDHYMYRIGSALGEALPRQVMIVPILFEQKTLAIMEIASFSEFTLLHHELLQQLAQSSAIIINSILGFLRTETLLIKTQEQSEQLQNNEEELRTNNEELARQGTEAEERNRQLEEAQAELEETSRYKSEFLANMSHELRTPLNSLLILAKMLSDNKEDNLSAKQKKSAETIYHSGNDLLNLINDILDLSKVEAGQMQTTTQAINLHQLAKDMQDSFAPTAQEKSVTYKVTVRDDVPASIVTDDQRLTQILRNFLSNAFKFTTSGTVSLDIYKAESCTDINNLQLQQQGAIAFSVHDTGIGIPADKQKMIFLAFQQIDASIQREYGGTGLGLSISKQLADLLNGEIHVQSKLGKGSTFTLYLPRTLEVSSAPATTKTTLTAAVCKNNPITTIPDDREQLKPDRQTILLLEDDPKFALIVVNLIHENGFNVLVSNDGAEGYILAKEFHPTGIILDLSLAGLSGQSALSRLKDDPTTRHIPVHVVAGTGNMDDVKGQGVIGFLQKPVSQQQLISILQRFEVLAKHPVQKLLLVEDNEVQAQHICELLGNHDMQVTIAASATQAQQQLKQQPFDCMVLDLTLPDMDGLNLLKSLARDKMLGELPVIVYTAKDLTTNEYRELNQYAQSVIHKSEKGAEKLLDEVVLFLHRMEANLPEHQRQILKKIHNVEAILDGKTVLLVDDDMRNIYALSAALQEKNMPVITAKNGREALEKLQANPAIDIVLMDIMMPEMDGFEAMRKIRRQECYNKLPVIALTAKAMSGDREQCIEAGASDYISKPIDIERLFSLMRVWLY